MKKGYFHICSVCTRCSKFARCYALECVRYCSFDFFIRTNLGLLPQYKCYVPCECGAELCNITCFIKKEDSNNE